MTSHKKIITYDEAFYLASLQFITFDHFESIHFILRLMLEIFDISIWWTSLWLFGHHTFSYKSLSLFPSRILVCAMAFAAHYLFSFWDLHILSSLSNKNKIVGRDISTSLTWLLTNHSWQAWRSIYNNHTKMSRFFPQRYKCKTNKLSAKLTS